MDRLSRENIKEGIATGRNIFLNAGNLVVGVFFYYFFFIAQCFVYEQ
jgi:hypothetical protein